MDDLKFLNNAIDNLIYERILNMEIRLMSQKCKMWVMNACLTILFHKSMNEVLQAIIWWENWRNKSPKEESLWPFFSTIYLS